MKEKVGKNTRYTYYVEFWKGGREVWCKVVEGSGGDTADWSDFRSFDTFMGRYLV